MNLAAVPGLALLCGAGLLVPSPHPHHGHHAPSAPPPSPTLEPIPAPPTEGLSRFLVRLVDKVFDGLFAFDPARFAAHAGRHAVTALVLVLAVVAASTAGRSALCRWRNGRHAEGARLVEIAAPPQVEAASAAKLWGHLFGLAAPWWKRLLFGQPHLAFEIAADQAGARFQIWVPGTVPPGLVEKTVRGAWPGAGVTTRPAAPLLPPGASAAGGRLVLARPDHHPIETKHPSDPLRSVLEAVTGLGEGETAAVQLILRPCVGRRLRRAHRAASALRGARSTAPQAAAFDLLTPGAGHAKPRPFEVAALFPERADQVRAILRKAAQPRYAAELRYGVATTRHATHHAPRHATRLQTPQDEEAAARQAARGWLRSTAHQLAAPFALFAAGEQFLARRRLHAPAARMNARRMGRGFLLCRDEIAALAHLPYDLDAPGITRAGARPVAPAPTVPAGGCDVRVLGDAEAGPPRPVGLAVAGARQHLHVLGQTGTGKSTFLANQILADARAGRGALVIDPKGDLITDILERLPERSIGRTVVFDPAEDGPPPCINVLAGADLAFSAEAIVTTFRRCFSAAWGPRMDDIMRSACLTLVKVRGPEATLAEVPQLLTDDRFRAQITASLPDPLLRGFWTTYEDLSTAGQSALISPVMNRLRAVLGRPFIQQALSGSSSTVDLGRTLNTGGLVLVRAAKGMLGEDAARLFGSLLLANVWQAITPRAHQVEADRRDVTAYVDEAHNFLNLPGSISDILAEARAYRLSLVVAHQHLSQLPRDLREAVSADARNKIYFTASPEDAAELARHTAPLLGAHDLSHLGGYQAAARTTHGNTANPPFTFRTRPLPEPVPGRAEAVRAASRAAFAPVPDEPDSAQATADGVPIDKRRHDIKPRTTGPDNAGPQGAETDDQEPR
ncbi:type IV secretion system DNA-binding domain-containing protein [Actinomadura parmotrematis]|uniref:Type IV secretion system DNA-binding domain-containing protein n=1 Tax=Actinomadura parmotrematis TaxID=2864039 RepID=A0ABS7G3M3_9ACTN|nr:type IV secretion system DNA-binding domain-containing protein [Actinomadura parmotrematis]MBW8487292.1 type IV secretion system DNA-binding domain-containing protein [Actinomadura parmotrematis]